MNPSFVFFSDSATDVQRNCNWKDVILKKWKTSWKGFGVEIHYIHTLGIIQT